VFFPFVAEHFPEHLARYQRSFRDGAYLSDAYIERMRALVRDIRQQVGLASRDIDLPPPTPPGSQMLLF
jgi:hypothetical protein